MKNVMLYRTKPLIGWAIEAAKASVYIDHLVISSDDDNILDLGKSYGAVPIKRPDWLSNDRAMTEGVAIHLLYTYKWADWVVLLQPTSPLRVTADIDKTLEIATEEGYALTIGEHGRRNGAVYACRSEWLISNACFHRDIDRKFLIMPHSRSLDVDYAVDFKFDPDTETTPSGREMMEQQWK